MNIQLTRFTSDKDTTLGLLWLDDVWECFTLEDQYRVEKVRGETRIPEGRYEVKFREVISPLTERYRKRFDWFEWHLEIQDVPGFKFVYIHSGNTNKDTDACLLVGSSVDSKGAPDSVGNSRPTFKLLYLKISAALRSGEEVFIAISDEPQK